MNVYLDHCASTPVHPDVLEACARALRDLTGNPSSVHAAGSASRRALDCAREQVAALIGAGADEIVFTSGATEANHLALRAIHRNHTQRAIAVTSIEHPSVLAPLERSGADEIPCVRLPVDAEGFLEEDALEDALNARPALASIGFGNHESGVLQSIDRLAARVASAGVLLHVDAAQALATEHLDLTRIPADLVTGSGHKLNGPPGIGFLRVRRGVEIAPLLRGGTQERGRRAGTPHVAGAVGLGVACVVAQRERVARARVYAALRDRLWAGLSEKIPRVVRHTPFSRSLPHVLHVRFEGVPGDWIVDALDGEGICVSSGAACASGARGPSPVLLAMGLDDESARGGVRFSVGLGVDDAQIDAVVSRLPDLVTRAREARA
jgi:cysteine desulfurase